MKFMMMLTPPPAAYLDFVRRAKKSKPKKAPVLKVKARVDKCRAYTTLACERLAQILPFVGIALGDAARMRVGSGTAEQAAQTLSVENHDVDVFALASLVFLMVSVYISSEWYGFVSSFCNKSGSKDKDMDELRHKFRQGLLDLGVPPDKPTKFDWLIHVIAAPVLLFSIVGAIVAYVAGRLWGCIQCCCCCCCCCCQCSPQRLGAMGGTFAFTLSSFLLAWFGHDYLAALLNCCASIQDEYFLARLMGFNVVTFVQRILSLGVLQFVPAELSDGLSEAAIKAAQATPGAAAKAMESLSPVVLELPDGMEMPSVPGMPGMPSAPGMPSSPGMPSGQNISSPGGAEGEDDESDPNQRLQKHASKAASQAKKQYDEHKKKKADAQRRAAARAADSPGGKEVDERAASAAPDAEPWPGANPLAMVPEGMLPPGVIAPLHSTTAGRMHILPAYGLRVMCNGTLVVLQPGAPLPLGVVLVPSAAPRTAPAQQAAMSRGDASGQPPLPPPRCDSLGVQRLSLTAAQLPPQS